jgi:glycosyltransferase involved in cell wall biosynthesis
VPIISTLQGEELFIDALPEPHRAQSIALLRRHAASIDRFVCCAQERIVAMASLLDQPVDRFAVVPTGIDPQPFSRAATARPRSPGPVILGYLSSIRPEKGLDLLVDALRQLVQTQARDLRLMIAGQVLHKGYWRQLRQNIRDAGLSDRVSCHGELDLAGKVRFLQQCDLFVMPTRLPESRALAAMEALAAGVPVIASRLGVLPELLERTGGGLTVAPDNAGALAIAIGELLNHTTRLRAHAEQGPAGISQHYSPSAMAQRTIEVYERLLTTVPASPSP